MVLIDVNATLVLKERHLVAQVLCDVFSSYFIRIKTDCAYTYFLYIDYNECDRSSTAYVDCGTGAKCINTDGSYRCECDAGFGGTPPNCTGRPILKRFYVILSLS